jgi:ABC-type transporter Mla maintaining outer membrane lipid asymmetry permease subunit MlaE
MRSATRRGGMGLKWCQRRYSSARVSHLARPRLRLGIVILLMLVLALLLIALFAPTRMVWSCPPRGSGIYRACFTRIVHIWELGWWTGAF